MKVTIVVPESRVNVDGESRVVSMTGIPVGVRIVQWDGTSGHLEFDPSSRRRNEVFGNFAPYQKFVDRWTAAGPVVVPPPVPPTDDEKIDLAVVKDPLIRGLIRLIAQDKATTEADIIAQIRALK